jgi:hypothetical protein
MQAKMLCKVDVSSEVDEEGHQICSVIMEEGKKMHGILVSSFEFRGIRYDTIWVEKIKKMVTTFLMPTNC